MLFNKALPAIAALLLASPLLAQTTSTVTTTYGTAPTITVGVTGCQITSATSIQYNPSANTMTIVGGADSCQGSGTQQNQAAIQLTAPSTFTIGTSTTATIGVTNSTSQYTTTCTLASNSGITVTTSTGASAVTNTGSFILTPGASVGAGTYTFTPTCTAVDPSNPTNVITTSVLPQTVDLTIVQSCQATNTCNTTCSASQTGVINGVTFARQCTGTVAINPKATSGVTYSGALSSLGAVLGNTTFPTFKYSGYSPTFSINSGSYISLAFTPNATGSFALQANTTYGDGGIITVSTTPGLMVKGTPGVVCGQYIGGSNSLLVTTTSPSPGNCVVTLGNTYYVNFVDAATNGVELCYGRAAGSCATGSSTVSYGFNSSN